MAEQAALEIIEDKFNINDLPAEVKEYIDEYGFEVLVANVSRWINHDNVIEREYSIDRLWIGRYVDFLNKAREWSKWRDADIAIALKKVEEIKKVNNQTKSSN